jgi:hypothetical protein
MGANRVTELAGQRLYRRGAEDPWFRTPRMLASRRTLRFSLIAVMAIWGRASAFPMGVEAGTVRDCELSASPSSCCVLLPEACTSCRTTSPLARPTAGTASSFSVGEGARANCNPLRCECRSSEPVAPSSKSESRRGGVRSDVGKPLAEAWLLFVLAPAPPDGVAFGESNRLRLPLHLLTTHLRF